MKRKDVPATVATAPLAVAIVVTVDHVYLPVDETGNVSPGWPASNVSTSKVLRDARLTAPDDLARFLEARKQAEVAR